MDVVSSSTIHINTLNIGRNMPVTTHLEHHASPQLRMHLAPSWIYYASLLLHARFRLIQHANTMGKIDCGSFTSVLVALRSLPHTWKGMGGLTVSERYDLLRSSSKP